MDETATTEYSNFLSDSLHVKSCLKKAGKSNNRSTAKRVYFKDVAVVEFPIIMGDNPAVSKGPPLTIGWTPQHWDEVKNVDDFEELRCRARRSRKRLVISSQKRVVILIGAGYDLEDIAERTLEMHKLKEQRAESLKSQGLGNAIWDVLSGSAETTGRTLRRLDVIPYAIVGGTTVAVKGTTEVVGLTGKVLAQATTEVVKGTGKVVMGTGKVVTDVAKGTGRVATVSGKAVVTGATEVGKGTGKVLLGTGRIVTDVLVGTGKVLVTGTTEVVRGTGKVFGAVGKPLVRLSSGGEYDEQGLGYHHNHGRAGFASPATSRFLSEDDDVTPVRAVDRRLSRSSSASDLDKLAELKAKEKQAARQKVGERGGNDRRTLRRNSVQETSSHHVSGNGAGATAGATNKEIAFNDKNTNYKVMLELKGMEDFLVALQGMDQNTLQGIMEKEKKNKTNKRKSKRVVKVDSNEVDMLNTI